MSKIVLLRLNFFFFFFRRKTKNFINTKQLNQLEKQSKLMIDITFFIKKRKKKLYAQLSPIPSTKFNIS